MILIVNESQNRDFHRYWKSTSWFSSLLKVKIVIFIVIENKKSRFPSLLKVKIVIFIITENINSDFIVTESQNRDFHRCWKSKSWFPSLLKVKFVIFIVTEILYLGVNTDINIETYSGMDRNVCMEVQDRYRLIRTRKQHKNAL